MDEPVVVTVVETESGLEVVVVLTLRELIEATDEIERQLAAALN